MIGYGYAFTLRLLILLLTCATLPASLAVAGPPAAVQTGSLIQLSNEFIAISLNVSNGTIASIVDSASGLNLSNSQAGSYHAMWGITLGHNSASGAPYADNNGSGRPAVTLANSASEASATLVWTGLNFSSGVKIGAATVTARIVLRSGDPQSHWTFRAEAIDGINPVKLDFPLIGGIGTLGQQGSDNRLFVPEQDGRLFSDPIAARINWARPYPSAFMSMQFVGYYNPQAGFYVASLDTTGQTKTMNWYSPPDSPNAATLHVTHFFPDEPTQNLVLPYETVVGVFHGDWTAAADRYKAWASSQSWVLSVASRQLPAWFTNSSFGRSQCAHGCGGNFTNTFSSVANEQAGNVAALGGSALLFLSGWEKLGAWYYGDDVPPAEGWSSFDQMVTTLHAQGNFLNLFIGANKLDAATPLWESGAANSSVVRRKDGTMVSETIPIGNLTHKWYLMNPGSDFWKQNLINTVTSLATHHVDTIQFDGWPIQDPIEDYAAGHPPGKGGNWQWLAWQRLLTDVEQAGRAIRPDLGFSTEGMHELLIPFVTYYEIRDVNSEIMSYSAAGTPVPAFGYVYKPAAQAIPDYWGSVGKPDTYHYLAFARALIWGQRPPFIYGGLGNVAAAVRSYYAATGQARGQNTRFLVEGTMLPPPRIASPATTVTLSGDGAAVAGYSGVADSIQAGAWIAKTGEVGVILTNISNGEVAFDLPIEFDRLKLVKGAFYSVSIEADGVSRSLGTISNSSSFPVTVGSHRIVVVTLVPKKTVFEFYNTDLDNYFITADAGEGAAIDNGSAGPGWGRTGNTFRADGSTPVCRFYGSISPGPNSHFYTVDPAECESLKQIQASTPATQKRWNFESLDFFSTPATGGTCPSGSVPVYRAYNNGFTRGVDSNHRITSSLSAIQDVVHRGWSDEGVVMCAPQ